MLMKLKSKEDWVQNFNVNRFYDKRATYVIVTDKMIGLIKNLKSTFLSYLLKSLGLSRPLTSFGSLFQSWLALKVNDFLYSSFQ